MVVTVPRKVQPVVDLAIQVAIGAVAFLAIYVVAVLLAASLKGIERIGLAPPWLATSADYIERAVFGVDVVALALFLVSELASFCRLLLQQWRTHDG